MTRMPPQPWIEEKATRTLLDALQAANVAVRFVGGCVRDALLGRTIADIDLASPAHPQEVIAALEKAAIKVVPTGLAHGTVTAVVPPRHYEITTLRRDVETFGRRARVAFDADWTADAERRDFTINAIYLDPDGSLHDPVGGLADLAAHRVRFVGDPATRIAEDVLRVLRYYRFEARFGTGKGDDDARSACRAAASRLSTLSAERVAGELFRLLAVPDPLAALRMMADDGVLAQILPEATRLDRLERLIGLEPRWPDPLRRPHPNPPPKAAEERVGVLRRLAALAAVDPDGAAAVAARLRLSNTERDRLVGLAPPWPIEPGADERGQHLLLYRLGAQRYRDVALLAAADNAIRSTELAAALSLASRWKAPRFPLAGRDVLALGIRPGVHVGELLGAVRTWWEEGGFAVGRAACLKRLRELAETRDGPL